MAANESAQLAKELGWSFSLTFDHKIPAHTDPEINFPVLIALAKLGMRQEAALSEGPGDVSQEPAKTVVVAGHEYWRSFTRIECNTSLAGRCTLDTGEDERGLKSSALPKYA